MDTRPYPRIAPGGIPPAMPGLDRKRLVVVDAHGHAFRAFWALEPMYAPDGLPTNALFGLAGLLRRLVLEERPDFVAVVFDAPDDVRRTFRTGLYPEYKAHRPERPAELARQIPILREVARAFGLRTLEHPDFEADDIVATLVAEAEAADVQTTILSADKDLMQLVSDRTLVWDAMRGKRYTQAAVEEKLGVGPALVADYLALVGDTSDNVPGVPGIGPKGAAGLLRSFGSLEAIYESLPLVPPREQKKLVEHRERAFLSRSLTRLRTDVPLTARLADLALGSAHAGDLGAALWDRLGFRSFLPPSLLRTRQQVRPAEAAPVPPPPDPAPAETIEDAAMRPVEEVHDLGGLSELVKQVRLTRALGLALAGGADERDQQAAPVLGLALPSGATWHIHLRKGKRGRPIQGTLFAIPEAEPGVALADVAAAFGSLLSDSRRVLCVNGGPRLRTLLGIAEARIALDCAGEASSERSRDAGLAALEALSAWLGREADPGRASRA